jgi:trehalose 6-phosphate synthase
MPVAPPLVVASNRLPVVLTSDGKGDWNLERGSGGLVTALEPVLRDRGGVWIGWPGVEKGKIPDLDQVLATATEGVGYRVKGVNLTAQEQDDFYLGFANQVIWPLFHDFQTQCNFDPRFWKTYLRVNEMFADVIAGEAAPGDFVWVHDYHLMMVAHHLRSGSWEGKLGFFLHIPFPPLDVFVGLPWRFQVMDALLSYDLVGFQTARDRRNFLHCVRTLVPSAEIEGEGRVERVHRGENVVRVGVFPVSVAFREFSGTAATDAVSERVAGLRSEFPGQTMILGVDRLDYSKGLPHKLQGYRLALERYPEMQGRIVLAQLVVPSREDIPEYYQLRAEVERLVGNIQGEFIRPLGQGRAHRPLPGGGHRAGHPPQGRDEPGGEGVLRLQPRGQGGAHPLRVRRCHGAAAEGRAAREPVRRRGRRRRHPPRLHDAPRRGAPPHALPA